VQIQIQIKLGKLLNIINESLELLQGQQIKERTFGPRQATAAHDIFKHSNPALTPQLVRRASRTLRLRWSLWDKRRLESVIKKFAKENERVHSQVELLCHATSVGIRLTHLDRLKTNEHSRKLGFDLPAQLHLNATELQTPTSSLQIKDEKLFRTLTTCSKDTSGLAVIEHLGDTLIVEFRNYAPDKAESVPFERHTKDRVELLAHLLCQKKDTVFHTLSCLGWMTDAHQNQVAFLFSVPEGAEANPFSLSRMFGMKDPRPSLGDRLRLARSLAGSICELQLVKWVRLSIHY
jgi:hypothetical protein